jgi:hypothetical protein
MGDSDWGMMNEGRDQYAKRVEAEAEIARLRAALAAMTAESDGLHRMFDAEHAAAMGLKRDLAEAKAQAFSGHDWNRLLAERDAALAAKEEALKVRNLNGENAVLWEARALKAESSASALKAEVERWKEEARRYADNAEHWRGLAAPPPPAEGEPSSGKGDDNG